MNKNYQLNYASSRPQMYDLASRKQKAIRIIKTLKSYFGKKKIKNLRVLDIGTSTGIIDATLAPYFKKVIGTDIDKKAIDFAKKQFKRKNLIFKVDDAMKLSFKDNLFDIVICTHVYEHVPSPKRLFREISRVLKKGGICYLAAQNKLWPLEAHHNLPFLSYLPKSLANKYIKIFRGKDEYYEHPMTYWQLKKCLKKFTIYDYTPQIFKKPKEFGYNIPSIVKFTTPITKYLTPTLFWILEKK